MSASHKKTRLFLSIISLVYFLGVQLLWVYNVKATLVGVFVELLTIPFIISIPLLLYFSIKSWFNNKWKVERITIATIIISLITLGLIFYWSI